MVAFLSFLLIPLPVYVMLYGSVHRTGSLRAVHSYDTVPGMSDDVQALNESRALYDRHIGGPPPNDTVTAGTPQRRKRPPRLLQCRNHSIISMFRGRVFTPEILYSEVPRILHYVWCNNTKPGAQNYFTYRHFLVLKSAISFLNLDAVYFFYDEYPALDFMWYHTWLIELETIFPFFVHRKTETRLLCAKDSQEIPVVNWDFIADVLKQMGGVYIGEYTMITAQVLPGMVEGKPLIYQGVNGQPALVASVPGYNTRAAIAALSNSEVAWPPEVIYRNCLPIGGYNQRKVGHCIDTSAVKRALFPKDQWVDNSSFSQLGRTLLYGKPDVPHPMVYDKDVIPKIAHYAYFGGGKMDFIWYLSVLSCLHVLKLDTVYIHGDLPPTGPYWDLLKSQEYYASRIQWIKRHRSHVVFSKRPLGVAHEADIANTDIMYKYGGVHCDPDLIFIKEFDPSFWRHETVFTVEGLLRPQYPAGISWGLNMAVPNSRFWRLIQNSQRCFVPTEWHWNSGRMLYKMYERNPELVFVQENLQVVCKGNGECWTSGIEGVPDKVTTNETGWLNKAYSLHYVHGNRALGNADVAKKDTTMHGRVARVVMRAAGLL